MANDKISPFFKYIFYLASSFNVVAKFWLFVQLLWSLEKSDWTENRYFTSSCFHFVFVHVQAILADNDMYQRAIGLEINLEKMAFGSLVGRLGGVKALVMSFVWSDLQALWFERQEIALVKCDGNK